MRKGDRKYIYIVFLDSEIIGYVDEYQPDSSDLVFVTIISDKNIKDTQWDTTNRDTEIAIDLKKNAHKWRFYENYEEFFSEFFDAIL